MRSIFYYDPGFLVAQLGPAPISSASKLALPRPMDYKEGAQGDHIERPHGKREDQMKAKHPTAVSPKLKSERQRLSELRIALLTLHKALVDSERVSYEKTVGQITSPGHFLQLLARDAWFAWLQPFSHLIVTLDQTLEAKPALTRANWAALVKQTSQLLVAAEVGEGFSGHYYAALQRDPDVVLAHAVVVGLIRHRQPPSPRPK